MDLLKRNVKINGKVYGCHLVRRIEHALMLVLKDGALADEYRTDVVVESYESEAKLLDVAYTPFTAAVATVHTPGMTFADAYALMAAHPMYREYVDEVQAALGEVLPLLTDGQAERVPQLFLEWAAGRDYADGVRVRHGGALYRCVQAHASQAGWEPPSAASLWTRVGEPGEVPAWAQPSGSADAYAKGDKVMHGGHAWTSQLDGNVWEPGVYGWDMDE